MADIDIPGDHSEKQGRRPIVVDWGDVWHPSSLPVIRSTPELAKWWRENAQSLEMDWQESIKVVVYPNKDGVFEVSAYHSETDYENKSSGLVEEIEEWAQSHCGRDYLFTERDAEKVTSILDCLIAGITAIRDNVASSVRGEA